MLLGLSLGIALGFMVGVITMTIIDDAFWCGDESCDQ